MKRFAELYAALDQTNKTNEKVAALASYFQQAPPSDAAWAISLLSGRRIRQVVPIRKLCEWAAETSGMSAWMFDECYEAVGDLAETVALMLPPPSQSEDESLTHWIDEA